MHGNLEPEERGDDWFKQSPTEHVNDLWEDMERLNALYEEMDWPSDDVLEFIPDYANNCIIIRNKSQYGR
tara:strand:+ start:350 stop:559 length:210 start_codon:yes stop_codon:yes gene_type:complete